LRPNFFHELNQKEGKKVHAVQLGIKGPTNIYTYAYIQHGNMNIGQQIQNKKKPKETTLKLA